jgi:NDP-4-keto-2,6-dideoxyhexose 3-C-methyltransferase
MKSAYREIKKCRICGNRDLFSILSLGRQALTGVFPKKRDQPVTAGPLELVKCDESAGPGCCGLVQLRQSYDKDEMYGRHYGYHSALNRSMVEHLHGIVKSIRARVPLEPGDLVVDIGSNDATLLKAYPRQGLRLIGMDPTGRQFRKYYPRHIELIADYFSAAALRRRLGDRKARVVTSIAMFYDLEAPVDFMREVHGVLADDGVWVLEQSYLPTMLKMNAYDTICHEHLEYYGLKQIDWMAKRVGFRIVDVELNSTNGGSFCVTLAKAASAFQPRSGAVDELLRQERCLSTRKVYADFRSRALAHRDDVRRFFEKARAKRQRVLGYGASTKGNVILQFCGITPRELPFIGEVNADKFGCYTPGTLIPIIPEREAKALRPDYLMVLPWHFKDFILSKEAGYLRAGGRLVFPLPAMKIHRA